MMGRLRSKLRGMAVIGNTGPAQLQLHTYATVALARFEQTPEKRGTTRMRWSNTGHPAPLVIRGDGTVHDLGEQHGELMLGVRPDSPRTEQVITLDRGATVLLYTDGLIERRTRDLDAGTAELRAVATELAHLPLDQLCDGIVERLVDHDHDDDVALVAIRLHRQDRPRPDEAGAVDVPPTLPDDPASAPGTGRIPSWGT